MSSSHNCQIWVKSDDKTSQFGVVALFEMLCTVKMTSLDGVYSVGCVVLCSLSCLKAKNMAIMPSYTHAHVILYDFFFFFICETQKEKFS